VHLWQGKYALLSQSERRKSAQEARFLFRAVII